MAKAYTKDFLVQAYAWRFSGLGDDVYEVMYELGNKHYDKVGRDTFRVHASLDADALKLFKQELQKYQLDFIISWSYNITS